MDRHSLGKIETTWVVLMDKSISQQVQDCDGTIFAFDILFSMSTNNVIGI